MRVLQVIHGYPMRYNAGSEVYTQTLSQGLAARHDVRRGSLKFTVKRRRRGPPPNVACMVR